jgi:hypothetical protein
MLLPTFFLWSKALGSLPHKARLARRGGWDMWGAALNCCHDTWGKSRPVRGALLLFLGTELLRTVSTPDMFSSSS